MIEYPKMLYKSGGDVLIDGEYFSTKIVNCKDDEDIEVYKGWSLTPIDTRLDESLDTSYVEEKRGRGRPPKNK